MKYQPRPNEKKADYLRRCVPVVSREQSKSPDDALAICSAIWDRAHADYRNLQIDAASDEMRGIQNTSLPGLKAAFGALVAAAALRALNKPGRVESARQKAGEEVASALLFADLKGRRRMLMEARQLGAKIERGPGGGVTGRMDTRAAVRDILSREPKLARTGDAVAKVYQQHGFAAAQAANERVAEKVRDTIARLMRKGVDDPTAARVVAEMTGWTEAYAETVYRTNVATAYSAGRFQMAQDEEVRSVAGAFELVELNDDRVRRGRPEDNGEHHLAGRGLIAGFSDEVWNYAASPNGYNCRGSVRLVSWSELYDKGLVGERGRVKRKAPANFASFAPHPRFRQGRPDNRFFGGRRT